MSLTASSLPAIADALATLRDRHIDHENTFADTVLPLRLKIGLRYLQSHVIFAHNPGKGGRPKKPSTVDGLSRPGFEGWLGDHFPDIKKPTAYRWMTSLRGLGLDENATEEQVDTQLEIIRLGNAAANLPAPTLKSLHDAAVEAVAPPALPPPAPEQQEFDFLRDSAADFRKQAETILGLKADLERHPAMLRAVQARAYSILRELTGTDWSPAAEPDPLALVDPDTITL